ncbi:MAG: hypothetical protein ABEI52_08820 [Halobacteriaceae archaeon]
MITENIWTPADFESLHIGLLAWRWRVDKVRNVVGARWYDVNIKHFTAVEGLKQKQSRL